MMRILYVVSNLYPNTAYTNRNKAAIRGFVENGCQCDVLSILPLISDEEKCLNKRWNKSNTYLNRILGIIYNLGLLIRSVKKYEVVYCVTCTLLTVRIALWITKKNHKIIVHECTEFPDVLYAISGKSNRSLKGYLNLVGKFDKLFVISHPIKQYFVEHGVSEERIHVFPMIVDPHRFDGLIKQKHDFRYIAYCGNMNNSKDGVVELIESFGLSQAKDSYKLMLIGTTPSSQLMRVYGELLDKYSITDRVIFRGQVERAEMPQILKDADLLVLCRPNNRQALGGFPTKLGEYLSTGNPVLVTRVGDIDKYIVDGVNGFLSAPDNVLEFATMIDKVFVCYENAQHIGEKGREMTFNEFNYLVQTKKVLDSIY